MAHELEIKNDVASMFSVIETPWHGLGHILAEAPSYAEGMALAGLDYPVEKVRLFRQVGQPEQQEFVQSEVGFATVRTDTGKELGSVGADYAVVENRDAFAVLEPLVDAGIAKLETGGTLRNGADAWLLVQWDLAKFGPIVREVFADEVSTFGLLSTNHTGKRSVLLKDTPIRVVCANTLGAAQQKGGTSVSVRHVGDASVRVVDAAQKMWGGIIERSEATAKMYRALKARRLDEAMFRKLVVSAVAKDPRTNDVIPSDLAVARYERKVAEVTRLWTEGKGHTGDYSAWEAYNAAVEMLDHNADLYPTKQRVASLLDGPLARTKDLVLANLTA